MDIPFTPGRKVNYLPQYLLVSKPKGVASEIVADTGRNKFGDRTCTLRLLEDAPAVSIPDRGDVKGLEFPLIPAGTVVDAYDRQVRIPGVFQIVAYATAFYHKRFQIEADSPIQASLKLAAMLKEDIGDDWASLPELTLCDDNTFDVYAEGDPDFEQGFGQ